MTNFDIGLTGLSVAQQALETAGTNLSNAATAGYHRQEVRVEPVMLGSGRNTAGGAAVAEVTRTGDPLVELAILRQQPLSGQIAQELTTLQNVEDTLGTVDSQGLGDSLSGFFDSLQQLASAPNSQPLLEQAASSADTMAGEFRRVDQSLADLEDNARIQTQQMVSQVNEGAQEIAQLNGQIQTLVTRGQNANLLLDQRDQIVSELSQLADIQVVQHSDSPGLVDVMAWGTSIVVNDQAVQLEAGLAQDGRLGVSVKGDDNYQTQATTGSIGALIGLRNGTLQGIRSSLDTLAQQIIEQVNQYHVQGVGTDGSFTELSGSQEPDGPLSSWGAGISAGTFYVRVTNQDTGEVARCAVAVSPGDTLSDVAARLSAVQVGAGGDHPLSASVAEGALHIQARSGYEFDFLPAPTPTPDSSTLTGTSQPAVSGLYDGAANQTYTMTVVGSGQVGVTDGLQVEVRNGTGELVRSLDVGAGYAAGDSLDIDHGLQVELSSGTLIAGQTFGVLGLASSDPTGFLAAAGINTFFRGDSAGSIAVDPRIMDDPGRIAVSLEPGQSDNTNASRLANLQSNPLSALGDTTPSEYFDQLVTNVGQMVQVRQTRQSAINDMIQQLTLQRDSVSGVDVNQEAAKLMVYQRMFQSVAKYLSVADQTLQYLNEMMT
jgi:flagellar hook-associated protein 1